MCARRQLVLLSLSNRLALLVPQIDPHPHGVNACSSALGLVGLRAPFLVREDADDLADEDAAVTPLMSLATGVPAAEQKCHRAALQQRARMVHRGITELSKLLNRGHRFSVDSAGSDLPVEGPVRQVEVAVDLAVLEAELNAWSAGQYGVPIRDGS